jgi:hypothetical protein
MIVAQTDLNTWFAQSLNITLPLSGIKFCFYRTPGLDDRLDMAMQLATAKSLETPELRVLTSFAPLLLCFET